MKILFKKFTLGLLILCPLLSHAEEAQTLHLKTCFEKAVIHSETLAIQEESLKIAEAHYLQALGTVLPHISVKGVEFIQDTSGGGGDGSVGNTLVRRTRPEVAMSLSQPLFQGFREFRALKISSTEKSKNSLTVKRARQALFADVARAYYAVLETEKEVAIRQAIQQSLQERIQNLQKRIHVGKSRSSELLTTEAELASVEADLEKSKGLMESAKDLLSFFIGEEIKNLLVDEFKVPTSLKPLSDFLAALEKRPDLQAVTENVRLTQGKLNYEKGGHFPTLNLDANYYPYRVGIYSDIRWDLNFILKFPLFEGFATQGKINEAASNFRQEKLFKEESLERDTLETRQAYHELVSIQAGQEALQRAETKSQASYQAIVSDEHLGLANNLEVLQALRQWQAQRLLANQSFFNTKLHYLTLLLASGELEP